MDAQCCTLWNRDTTGTLRAVPSAPNGSGLECSVGSHLPGLLRQSLSPQSCWRPCSLVTPEKRQLDMTSPATPLSDLGCLFLQEALPDLPNRTEHLPCASLLSALTIHLYAFSLARLTSCCNPARVGPLLPGDRPVAVTHWTSCPARAQLPPSPLLPPPVPPAPPSTGKGGAEFLNERMYSCHLIAEDGRALREEAVEGTGTQNWQLWLAGEADGTRENGKPRQEDSKSGGRGTECEGNEQGAEQGQVAAPRQSAHPLS